MRLLVVEDDHLLNNTLCYNLSAAGYTVDAAMTKTAAVSFCEAQDYDFPSTAQGIGIGLYLALEIVTMQGGYIKVASKVGDGSTFSVFLPHG